MLRLPVPVAQIRVFPDEARDKLLWRILGHSCWAGWVLSLQHLGYYLFYENEEGDGRQTLFHWKKVFPPGWFCELRGLTLTAQRQPSAAGREGAVHGGRQGQGGRGGHEIPTRSLERRGRAKASLPASSWRAFEGRGLEFIFFLLFYLERRNNVIFCKVIKQRVTLFPVSNSPELMSRALTVLYHISGAYSPPLPTRNL